jgi:hypothetical protein
LTWAAIYYNYQYTAMEQVPPYVSLVFGITTVFTIWFFYQAAHRSRTALYILLGWILVQAVVSYTGFYRDTSSLPPRFVLLVLPPLLFIILLFATPAGRRFLDRLDPARLTLLHVVRLPVEIVLFWLFTYGAIPQVMTFEGRNFDFLSGITAPMVWYLGYVKKSLPRPVILAWNLVCLALLFNIVGHAALSVPSPIQQLAFDQPNIAVLHFPFVWLPCCVVPLVLLSHLATIRNLQKFKSQKSIADVRI